MNIDELVQKAIVQQQRAAELGFDWPDDQGVFDKVQEELLELRSAQTPAQQVDEMGDVLFVLINLARRWGLDIEAALSGANQKFVQRFACVEQSLLKNPNASLAEMEAWWQQAKSEENTTEA